MIDKLLSNIPKLKTKDAFRLAIQSAASAAITYAVLSYFDLPELFVGVLSAVLVVEPSIANTLEQSKGRVVATIVGCIIGFICASFIPYDAGTALSLALSMFIMNGISLFRPSWRYGVVAAVAIALGSPDNAFDRSMDRIIAIFVGITIGILTSLIVWPEKASTRSQKHLSDALRAASKRFSNAIDNTRSENSVDEENSTEFHVKLSNARAALKSVKIENVDSLRKEIENVERLYNSILIIHRVAVHAKEDVSDGSAGIKKDTEKVKKIACQITKSIADQVRVKEDKVDEFKECVSALSNNINLSKSDNDINVLRNSLLFGLSEVEEALIDLTNNSNQRIDD